MKENLDGHSETDSELFNRFANTSNERPMQERAQQANIFEIPRVITTSDVLTSTNNDQRNTSVANFDRYSGNAISTLLIDEVAHQIIEDALIDMCWGDY